jgi:hypothetical protein
VRPTARIPQLDASCALQAPDAFFGAVMHHDVTTAATVLVYFGHGYMATLHLLKRLRVHFGFPFFILLQSSRHWSSGRCSRFPLDLE